MPELPYRRVALSRRVEADAESAPAPRMRFRWVILLLSSLLCSVQAVLTITASNVASQYPTSTLITVIGFGFLMLLAVLINPLVKFIFRGLIKPLSRAELMGVIASLMVTAGISTFGLSDVLVPVITAPWNPEWNTPQRGWDMQLHPHLRKELYITDPQAIRLFREGISGQPTQDAPIGEWGQFYLKVLGQIPWLLWLKPLGCWMIFVAGCYGLFWSLSYLVLDLWAKREKLIFPLAQLPEALLPPESPESSEDGTQSILPTIVREPLFWTGFALSFLVLCYNAAAISNWIPMAKLALGMGRFDFNVLVDGSFLSGLAGGVTFLIIFTCIGIAFLLPLEISFSVWFYFCLGRFLILVMVRQGYGQDFRDFPSDWTWTQNPIAALGMGGILFFSGVTLFRALRDISQQSGKAETIVRSRRRLPLIGFAVSILVVIAWLSWNRLPVIWAIVIAIFLVLITLGLMRIVAESGVFWIQSNAGFFHLYKMLGLSHVLAPVFVAPLIPIYAILFFDIKTFIAPNILNAAKMHENVGGDRFRFHLNMALSVITSIVTAIGYSILLAYGRGARQMNTWFYSNGPRRYFEQATQATTTAFPFEPTTFGWFLTGGAWVALTIFLRQTLFWFPHPVGFIMNINPLMQYLWFSFFIGWAIKKLTIKYGGQASFQVVRQLMIGLIFGELFAIFVTAAMNLFLLESNIRGIDLNRYGP